jgi:hypothetical protein
MYALHRRQQSASLSDDKILDSRHVLATMKILMISYKYGKAWIVYVYDKPARPSRCRNELKHFKNSRTHRAEGDRQAVRRHALNEQGGQVQRNGALLVASGQQVRVHEAHQLLQRRLLRRDQRHSPANNKKKTFRKVQFSEVEMCYQKLLLLSNQLTFHKRNPACYPAQPKK